MSFFDSFDNVFFVFFTVSYFVFTSPLDSRMENPNGLFFLMMISSLKDLFKIRIQIRCGSELIASISSVLNFEVKYPS